jgi:hypothetical protein
MSEIVFHCPLCNRTLQVNAVHAGVKVSCPHCRESVEVPEQDAFAMFSARSDRPTSVTILGALNIVLGSIGIICLPVVLAASLAQQDALAIIAMPRPWQVISVSLSPFVSIWLLVTGIGLLKLKRWARRGATGYGWFGIVFGTIQLCITVVAFMANSRDLPAGMGSDGLNYLATSMVGAVLAGIVALAYPILLVIFMSRPKVINACYKR